MDLLKDPSVFALPHPVRFDAALGQDADTMLLREFGLLERLRPYLADPTASTEWLLNTIPGLRGLALGYAGAPGAVNIGTFVLQFNRTRLRAHGDPILQVTPALQALLAETDLAAGLPAGFFRSPYPMAFIEFARPNPLRVPNILSGLHECEGAYVGMYDLAPHHPVHAHGVRTAALRLDPGKPTRAIEIVITGSPAGKDNTLDDSSQDLLLLIQDEDECLSSVLERHIALFQTPKAYGFAGLTPYDPADIAMMKPVVLELAKVLLYLNLPDAETVRLPEREDLARRLRGLGPKKAARLKRRLVTAYDRIIIGPGTPPAPASSADADADAEAGAGGGDSHRTLRPHWRRGHFRRIRYGEGLSESRLGWIQPCLVKAAEAFGSVKTKPW